MSAPLGEIFASNVRVDHGNGAQLGVHFRPVDCHVVHGRHHGAATLRRKREIFLPWYKYDKCVHRRNGG